MKKNCGEEQQQGPSVLGAACLWPLWWLHCTCQHPVSYLLDHQLNPHSLTCLLGLTLDSHHHHSFPKGPPDTGWPWTLPLDMILIPGPRQNPSLPALKSQTALTAPQHLFHFPSVSFKTIPFLGPPHLFSSLTLLLPLGLVTTTLWHIAPHVTSPYLLSGTLSAERQKNTLKTNHSSPHSH